MINIALDGPSGAGKSSVARTVAGKNGIIYVDTGAMFRSLAWKALKLGIDISNEKDKICSMLNETKLDIRRSDGQQLMFVDGTDVTGLIRTPEVSRGASDIAAIVEVRKWLLETERELASKYDCIMDGRDIGTFVLPNADVKIFLTASAEVRAKRRMLELEQKGLKADFEKILADMKYRDKQDSTRKTAPLKCADDAKIVDTSDIDFDETVAVITDIIRQVTKDV